MNEMAEREVVSFKGTRSGILMSILEDEPFGVAIENLRYKISANKNFFSGSPVSLDLGWRELENEDLNELLECFKENGINLLGVISTSLNTRRLCEDRGLKVIIGRLGLADHHGNPSRKASARITPIKETAERPAFSISPPPAPSNTKAESTIAYPTREMEMPEETLLVKKTVRSGQTVEHPGNLVIIGDVNPGGEVKAGGDIIIIGALRGIAHAGLRNRDDATVTALKFKPTQIRIKDIIANTFDSKVLKCKQPVIAGLSGGNIEFRIYQ